MSGVSTFDKYIKMSWQMVTPNVIISGFTIGMMLSMAEFIGMVAIVFLVIALAAVVSAAKKTFFNSLYGNSAVTYQSLPVSSEEMVLAKVSVMTAVSLITVAVMLIILMFVNMFGGDQTFADYVGMLTNQNNLNEFHIPYIMAAGIAGMIAGHLRMWFVFFAAVVWYNSRTEAKKNGLMKLAAGAGALALQWVLNQPESVMTRMSGETYWLPAQAVAIVINIIAAAVLYKYIVRRVSNHYELS